MDNGTVIEQFNNYGESINPNTLRPQRNKRNVFLLIFIVIGALLIVGAVAYVIWQLSIRRENTPMLQFYSELQESASMGWFEDSIRGIDENAEFEVDFFGDGFARVGQDEYILFTCNIGIDENDDSDAVVMDEDYDSDDDLPQESLDDDEVDDSEEWDNSDLESQGTYSPSNLAYDFMYMREIGDCQYYITKSDDDRFLMSNCDEMNEFPTKDDAIQAYLSGR